MIHLFEMCVCVFCEMCVWISRFYDY